MFPNSMLEYFEVEQMIALSLQEGNATSDDALSKPKKWDDWDDEALWDEYLPIFRFGTYRQSPHHHSEHR